MRIYLSSTLNDLKDERDAVKAALAGLGHYTVVESYDADEMSVRESCLADVASCELYIGIVGLRYGFIPPGQTKSITELEFDAASGKGLRCLVFLKDEHAITADKMDAHTKEHEPTLIEAFRKRLSSGGSEVPRPTIFSDCGQLKEGLLRALMRGPGYAVADPFVPAPDGETELQRMLSKRLNACWPQWRASAALGKARFCVESETRASDSRGMPFDLYCAAVADDPLKILKRLDDFVVGGADAGEMARAFCTDANMKEIVLHVGLVAAERYIQNKREKDGRRLQEGETLAGNDERLHCILAAASFGFGVKLDPGQRFPRNFARFPTVELGYEDPRDVIVLELFAQARRMKGVSFEPEPVDVANLDEDILIAELDDIRSYFGCGLVATDRHDGPLSDAKLRQSIRDGLGVPTILVGPPSFQASEDARWLLDNLKRLIGPLIDGALGPQRDEPATPETDNAAQPKPRTEP